MQRISIAELLLVIYVIVDDWYLTEGQIILQGKPGRKPQFTDSEMITLMMAQDDIPYPGEKSVHWLHQSQLSKIVSRSDYTKPIQSTCAKLAATS